MLRKLNLESSPLDVRDPKIYPTMGEVALYALIQTCDISTSEIGFVRLFPVNASQGQNEPHAIFAVSVV